MDEKLDNIEVLDNIIIWRIIPHIYAFKTNSFPNYLKIWDTCRSVKIRLDERRKHFPDLELTCTHDAIIDNHNFFRDYSVHQYIENDLKKDRLKNDNNTNSYYSNEFFKWVKDSDINQAIEDIKSDFRKHWGKYTFYDLNTSIPQPHHFTRSNEEWEPRPNQREAINNFVKAVNEGRKNLLMYAVMRFWKSFTSMMCAKEINAKLIVVVSAKADVKSEWKKTVEVPKNFDNFNFVDSDQLVANEDIISKYLEANKKVVVFLTLQDLQWDFIKDKHKALFTHEHKIDLLIVDETHFWARWYEYWKILKEQKINVKDVENTSDEEDSVKDSDELNKTINKVLNRNITLHLSGTPYKILMGREFDDKDVICFYQFSDIVEAQKQWDVEHPDDNEWDNPYFGFPQMIRFAFNPSKKAREKLEALKQWWCSYAFYALLKPKSIKKADDWNHKIFENEEEVLELLEVIDWSKQDENVLWFLDYQNIQKGNMCRHIVMVLPYCASCDAMEALIKGEKFKNLNKYEIINISWIDNPKMYKSTTDIKNKIKECEDKEIKTITLTVNRMLTGSTVEQWDTMIYLKDTASPQEYDQAIFRLQNQYVKKATRKGWEDFIKYNMKPQTILVDFDPNRMFKLQEKKAQIYNVNTDEWWNSRLNERLRRELEISPIITLNSNRIQQVEPIDILRVVSEYKMDRWIKEEALEIPVDLKILEDPEILAMISRENELDSKNGLFVPAVDWEEKRDDLDVPETTTNNNPEDVSWRWEIDNWTEQWTEDGGNKLKKKLLSYRTKILLYAFLMDESVISLSDIIKFMDNTKNVRIAKNIWLNKQILTKIYNYYHANNKQILSQLDYKIQDLSELSHNAEQTPEERAQVVLKKFWKLWEATVVTPTETCKKMMESIPNNYFTVDDTHKIIDIAWVSWEFVVAIYNQMTRLDINSNIIKNSIYTITKSSVCYELTRKLYEMLWLNVKNIATFYSEDLIDIKDETWKVDYWKIKDFLTQNKEFSKIKLTEDLVSQSKDNMITFNAVVWNPPYQSSSEKTEQQTQENSSWIYPHFQNIADEIGEITCLIYPFWWWFDNPLRLWWLGNKILTDKHTISINAYEWTTDKRAWYRTDKNPEPIFWNTANLSAWVSIVLRDKQEHDSFEFSNRVYSDEVVELWYNDIESLSPNPTFISINKKLVWKKLNVRIKKWVFWIESNFVELNPSTVSDRQEDREDPIILYTNDRSWSSWRAKKYRADKSVIQKGIEYLPYNKVIMISAYPKQKLTTCNPTIENVKRRIGELIEIMESNSAFWRSKLALFMSENKEECNNFIKYMHTDFFAGLTLQEPNRSSSFWYIIPDQNFTNKSDIDRNQSIENIDQQLFNKYNLTKEEINFIKGN